MLPAQPLTQDGGKGYQAFVAATGRGWKKPDFEQGPTHPAVNVSWADAKAYCAWLTEKERHTGALTPNQEYRLPTDLEWSVAVGLEKEPGSTPEERDKKIKAYPWGGAKHQPPRGTGNYGPQLKVDDFDNTSPVGSFAANRFGLYDMGGNVWQWCEDFYDNQQLTRVLRGSSWFVSGGNLVSSARHRRNPLQCFDTEGFRCVLSNGGASAPQAQSTAASTPAVPPLTPASSMPTSSGTQPDTNQNVAKTLSQKASNVIEWALAPLDRSVPADIRQNLRVLREDLLDEAKAKPIAGPQVYEIGSQLCNALIAVLDERDQASVRAGYRAAQAEANTGVNTQAGQPEKVILETRRNYMMSWPQYARERDARTEVQRQQINTSSLTRESVKVEWSNRTAALRRMLDVIYAKYRDALRPGKK